MLLGGLKWEKRNSFRNTPSFSLHPLTEARGHSMAWVMLRRPLSIRLDFLPSLCFPSSLTGFSPERSLEKPCASESPSQALLLRNPTDVPVVLLPLGALQGANSTSRPRPCTQDRTVQGPASGLSRTCQTPTARLSKSPVPVHPQAVATGPTDAAAFRKPQCGGLEVSMSFESGAHV